jgi:hypothetical protein
MQAQGFFEDSRWTLKARWGRWLLARSEGAVDPGGAMVARVTLTRTDLFASAWLKKHFKLSTCFVASHDIGKQRGGCAFGLITVVKRKRGRWDRWFSYIEGMRNRSAGKWPIRIRKNLGGKSSDKACQT